MLITARQNASLHKYCTSLADAFNDAGYDQKAVLDNFRDTFHVPWTQEAVKTIFRAVAHAMYKIESTKELTTTQIQEVYRVMDKRLSEITGVTIAWPSIDSYNEEKE